MPFSVQLETSYFRLKYDSTEGWNFTLDAVERAKLLQVRTTSMKELILAAVEAGGTVLTIGVTIWQLFRLGIAAFAWLPNCLIFKATIPSDKKDEFNQYVASELANELNSSYSEVRNLLKSELGDDFSKIPLGVLESLEKTTISEATICDDAEIQKAKEAALAKEAEKVPPSPPTNLSLKEHDLRPSTSLLVFYKKPQKGDVDKYIVTAKSLESDEMKEVPSEDEFAKLDDLKPGQLYLLWVQSVKGEIRSEKCILRDPVRTALFDPYSWGNPDATESTVGDSGVGTGAHTDETESVGGTDGDDSPTDLPALWNSDLHNELKNIFRVHFPDLKMKQLLGKCLELGIVEAKDLKFFGAKEVSDEMKTTLKVVEILKLVDCSQGLYSINSGAGTGTRTQNTFINYNFDDHSSLNASSCELKGSNSL